MKNFSLVLFTESKLRLMQFPTRILIPCTRTHAQKFVTRMLALPVVCCRLTMINIWTPLTKWLNDLSIACGDALMVRGVPFALRITDRGVPRMLLILVTAGQILTLHVRLLLIVRNVYNRNRLCSLMVCPSLRKSME